MEESNEVYWSWYRSSLVMSWENLSFKFSTISDKPRCAATEYGRGLEISDLRRWAIYHLYSQNKHSHEMSNYGKVDLCLCFRISSRYSQVALQHLHSAVHLCIPKTWIYVYETVYICPKRCEPSIKVSVRRGGGMGVTVHITKESKLSRKC